MNMLRTDSWMHCSTSAHGSANKFGSIARPWTRRAQRGVVHTAAFKPRGRRDNLGLEELRVLQKQKPPVAGGDDENKQGDDDVLMLDLGLGDEEDWLDVDDDDDNMEGMTYEESVFDINEGWSLDALSPEELDQLMSAADEQQQQDVDEEDEGIVDEHGRVVLGKVKALQSLPQHMIDALEQAQHESEVLNKELRPAALKAAANTRKLHRKLKIIAGSAAGRMLVSARGLQTRPMMEKVRAAVFSMIHAQLGGVSRLPAESRWLDLFAGTGAVGLEALSRGCGQAHFVELDPWVVDKCLKPNVDACRMSSSAVLHTGRAEDFLARGRTSPRSVGGAFDFISVCPPYLLVSYPELYDLLSGSPLLHEGSIVLVEYPKQLAHEVRDEMKPLKKIKDRKYGRTYLAVYGPADAEVDDVLLV